MRSTFEDNVAFDLHFLRGKLGMDFFVLGSTYTIGLKAKVAHFLDAGGSTREVHLPIFAVGIFFYICNIGVTGSLTVKTAGGGTTVATIPPGEARMFLSGDSEWAVIGGSTAETSAQMFLLRSIGGTAAAITANTGFSLTALAEHQMFRFKPGSNSTGATTIAIDGLAAVHLRSPTGAALGTDDIHTGFYYDMVAIGTPVTELRICRF